MRHRGAPAGRIGPRVPKFGPPRAYACAGAWMGGHMGREERKGPAPTWMAACAGLVLLALMLLAAAAETIGTTSTSAAPPASRIKYTK